jgi:hypothetical protein
VVPVVTIPILGRDDSFPALCARVRRVILAKHGKTHATEYLLLLDLIEMLGIDKADRVKTSTEEPRA